MEISKDLLSVSFWVLLSHFGCIHLYTLFVMAEGTLHLVGSTWRVVVGVVAFRLANALLVATSFAPDEYYQAMDPAYIHASDRLWAEAPASHLLTGVQPPQMRSLRQLSWEWTSDEALRPVAPVLALAQLHRVLLWAEERCFISSWAAGYMHARAARIAGGLLAAAVDLATPHLATRLLDISASELPPPSPPPPPPPPLSSSYSLVDTVQGCALGWSLLSHWLFFAMPRPLVNSWEAAFTTGGVTCILSPDDKLSAVGAVCAALALVLRASSAPFWLFVLLWKEHDTLASTHRDGSRGGGGDSSGGSNARKHWRRRRRRLFARWMGSVAAPAVLLVVAGTVLADSYWFQTNGGKCHAAAGGSCESGAVALVGSPDEGMTLRSLGNNLRTTQWNRLLNSLWWSPVGWVRFNALHARDAASRFGAHPFYWYVTAGAWALVAPQLLAIAALGLLRLFAPSSAAMVHRTGNDEEGARHMDNMAVPRYYSGWHLGLAASGAYIAVLSVVPHKEDRFLTPLVSFANAYSAVVTANFFRRKGGVSRCGKTAATACLCLLAALSAAGAYYLTRWHQAGPEAAFHKLRNRVSSALDKQAIQGSARSLHILAPCFSTPGLAFLHAGRGASVAATAGIDAWMLECESQGSAASSSVQFGRRPYSVATALYRRPADLPDYLATWGGASGLGVVQGAEEREARRFSRWLPRHFEVISRDFHGHIPTTGTSYFVVWRRRGEAAL